MHVFKHPKFYEEFRQRAKRCQKELRERNKSDSVISSRNAATAAGRRAPGPGLMKSQATSKSQAASVKLSNQPVQVSSDKHPNHNHKRQASSPK